MLKIGEVILTSSNTKYSVVWYSDNEQGERIDVVTNLSDYRMVDTSDCVVSYLRGASREEVVYGDMRVLQQILRIKAETSFLHVPEKKEVSVDGGMFSMSITKESPDESKLYKVVLTAGKLISEYYETQEGIINIDNIQDSIYVATNRPINWDSYEPLNTIGEARITSKHSNSEQGEYYSYDELIRKYPQVLHVLDNDYEVVQDYDFACKRLQEWIDSPEQLKSVDIESRSTDWGPYSENRITGVFLGFGESWSTYFPFRQDNFPYNLPIEFLRKVFDAVNNQPEYPTVIILSHNGMFEIKGFYQEFRDYLRVDIDTYILGVLINPVIQKGSHTLKALASKVDNKFYLTLNQIFIGPVKFNVLPPEIVKIYGCPDATSPAKVYKQLIQELPKDELFVMHLDMQLPVIKAMNEFYGIRLDEERLLSLIENEEYKVQMLGDLFRSIHHTSRNINSNDVLSDILYNKLRCKVEIYTKSGKPATSKSAIDRIVSLGSHKIAEDAVIPKPIIDKHGKVVIDGEKLASNDYPSLIIYQQYKLCGKELGALKRLQKKSVGGRFMFYINQVGAGSNRQTSDAHQFSDTMKSCVLADSPYHDLCSCDWKQIELRVLAGAAKQEDLIELERDPEVDIHRAIASIIKKKPMWQISEEERKKDKSVNFGVVYMMSEYGLVIREVGPGYSKAELQDCAQRIADFFNGLPNIKMFLKNNETTLLEKGYIKTLFNYYRWFKELLDPTLDPKLKKRMIRSGNNTPVQGTAAQMLKIVETKVWRYIREHGWDKEKNYDGIMLPMVRMILPIHDEILLSYDKTIPKEEIIKMFKECMELDIKGMPPFFAAPAFINNWYDGKNAAYEVDIPFRDKIVEEYEKGNLLLTGHDYLETLLDYRSNQIKTYLEGLIAKYKTVDEVAKHVTHDTLTHTIIETLIPSKGDRKKLTHEERIHEAVRRYMEQLDNKGLLDAVRDVEVEDEDKTQYMDMDEWAATYTHIDANGDLIIEQESDEYFEEDLDYEFDPLDDGPGEDVSCLYLMNECLIDLTGLDVNGAAEYINQEVQKLSTPDAFYPVVYCMGAKLIPTPIKVPYIPDKIKALVNEVRNKDLEVK